MDDSASFVVRLLRAVPELESRYEQHMTDNDSLLPHVFMGEVSRFAVSEAGRPASNEALKRLLEFLEREIGSGSLEIEQLIVVSFVENLIGEDVALSKLSPLMGENTRREVRAICGM